jgi:hypothetical protein
MALGMVSMSPIPKHGGKCLRGTPWCCLWGISSLLPMNKGKGAVALGMGGL